MRTNRPGLIAGLAVAGLAAGAYTGFKEVSAEAEDVNRRLEAVVLAEPLVAELDYIAAHPPATRPEAFARRGPALREAAARLRGATAGGPGGATGRALADLADQVLAAPADDTLLREALGAARIAREAAVAGARTKLRDHADRPATRRARDILYGSAAAAFLGSLVFTLLFVKVLRERRAAEERVRRSEALAALGTLAAGVAHEVNNPVGTIAACADAAAARLRASPPDTARAAALLESIGGEARRTAGIVRDLMDLARDGEPAKGPVDLGALVRETVELSRLNPRLRRVEVALQGDGAGGVLLLDAARVKQAILNLLANAVDASPEGSRVEVSVRGDPEGAEVLVRDHGPGVPAAERRRIFEPFRTGRPGGTGIGLTIVQRVAASHGGSVEVEDAPGGGALFRLRLPGRPRREGGPALRPAPAAGG